MLFLQVKSFRNTKLHTENNCVEMCVVLQLYGRVQMREREFQCQLTHPGHSSAACTRFWVRINHTYNIKFNLKRNEANTQFSYCHRKHFSTNTVYSWRDDEYRIAIYTQYVYVKYMFVLFSTTASAATTVTMMCCITHTRESTRLRISVFRLLPGICFIARLFGAHFFTALISS